MLLLGKFISMRKRTNLLLCFLLLPFLSEAQLPNPGFELLNPDSTLMNWRFTGILSIGMNDSLLEDGFTIGKSTDAHSGQYALELRNAFNVTTNTPLYVGSVMNTLPDTTMYQGFNIHLPITGKPTSMGFYYKFSQNPYQDSANAWIRVYNSAQTEIGFGKVIFWDVAPNYQYLQVPITYNFLGGQIDSIPAYVSVGFSNLINLSAGPHVGERTLLDDVSLDFTPTSVNTVTATTVECFPNPVCQQLFLRNTEPGSKKILFNSIG